MAEQFVGLVEILDAASNVRITLDGDRANISAGGNGFQGRVLLENEAGQQTVNLNGGGGDCTLGGNGVPGDLVVKNGAGLDTISLHGNSNLIVRKSDGEKTIHLDGNSGDIVLSNADCAEDFGICSTEKVEPGTVMVLDQEDKLRQCTGAYDKRVAGVIAGAGGYRPGIVLDKKHSQNNRLPVALLGKVYCKVDAQYLSIEVGDLLTTSPTPGHAMKADDPFKAFGAVIGKALRPLVGGQALVPILVCLQ